MVAEKDDGKRFTATFRAGVILRTRRAAWSLTQGHTMFCQITPFIFIVAPKKLYSEETNRGQGFQTCGTNLLLSIGHVIRRMRSGCKCIVDALLWEMSELITQEWIAVGSSNLVEGLIT